MKEAQDQARSQGLTPLPESVRVVCLDCDNVFESAEECEGRGEFRYGMETSHERRGSEDGALREQGLSGERDIKADWSNLEDDLLPSTKTVAAKVLIKARLNESLDKENYRIHSVATYSQDIRKTVRHGRLELLPVPWKDVTRSARQDHCRFLRGQERHTNGFAEMWWGWSQPHSRE